MKRIPKPTQKCLGRVLGNDLSTCGAPIGALLVNFKNVHISPIWGFSRALLKLDFLHTCLQVWIEKLVTPLEFLYRQRKVLERMRPLVCQLPNRCVFSKQSLIFEFEVVEESIKIEIWIVFALYALKRGVWTQFWLDGRIKRSRHQMGDTMSVIHC